MTGQTIARKGDDARALWVLGGLYEVLVSAEESGGTATVMRMTMPADMGPPPHTHPGAEIVYVVSGDVTFHIGDELVPAGPGACFHFPAGTREWFVPNTRSTVIATYLPGGIDGFFEEVGEPALARDVPPPAEAPPDLARIQEVAARYGMMIEAPPG